MSIANDARRGVSKVNPNTHFTLPPLLNPHTHVTSSVSHGIRDLRLLPRRREHHQLLHLGHVRALAEVVVVVFLDGVEDVAIDVERGPHGPAGIRVEAVHPSLSLREHFPRARDLELHERLPPVVNLASRRRVETSADDLFLRDAEIGQLVERHVDAVPGLDILAHVAEDVRELVRESEGERGFVHLA